MTERDIAVYSVVLDLIYDGEHQTFDDPKHIASYFSDLGSASVRRTIDRLVEAGKLVREGEFLTNKRAKNEGKTREELKKSRRHSAHLGSVSSGKSRSKPNEVKNLSEANASPDTALDKIGGDIEVKEEAKASSKKRGSRLPENWSPSPDLVSWAVTEGLSEGEARRDAEKFQGYWLNETGQRASKIDWDRAFHTWVRNEVDTRRKRKGSTIRDANGDLTHAALFGRG